MSEMKLNQRQMGVFRTVVAEAQAAQVALNTAQAKVSAFFETIKAQYDIPDEVQSIQVEDDGAISFNVPNPPPPPGLPPHPIVEAAKAMLGASAAAGSGLSLVEPHTDITAEPQEAIDG